MMFEENEIFLWLFLAKFDYILLSNQKDPFVLTVKMSAFIWSELHTELWTTVPAINQGEQQDWK